MKPLLLLVILVSFCHSTMQSEWQTRRMKRLYEEQRDTIFSPANAIIITGDTTYVYQLIEIRIKVNEGEKSLYLKGGK